MVNKKLINVAVLLGDPRLPDPVKNNGKFNPEDIAVVDRLKETLKEMRGYQFTYLDNHENMFGELERMQNSVDYAFNLCDEGLYNDPAREADVPIMLEELGIRHTGAGAECMRLCYNKNRVRSVAKRNGVPVASGLIIQSCMEHCVFERVKFPSIVKPAKGDGSFGINQKSVVKSLCELIEAKDMLRKELMYEGEILVEEFLGGDEITMGIIGNKNKLITLPPIKEDYSSLPEGLPRICGFEAKWDPNSPYWNSLKSIPADLERKTREQIERGSIEMFKALGCQDYARFDWRLNSQGEPKLLEGNPNCGWCHDGHLGKMCNLAGITYGKMLEMILKSAEERIGI